MPESKLPVWIAHWIIIIKTATRNRRNTTKKPRTNNIVAENQQRKHTRKFFVYRKNTLWQFAIVLLFYMVNNQSDGRLINAKCRQQRMYAWIINSWEKENDIQCGIIQMRLWDTQFKLSDCKKYARYNENIYIEVPSTERT